MQNQNNVIEYGGYSVKIERTPVDPVDGQQYWTFSWGKNGQSLLPVGKKFGGYEIALAEAKKIIDRSQKRVF